MEVAPHLGNSKPLPNELTGRPPHRVRLTGTGWLYASASAFFIFLAAYFSLQISQAINKNKAIQNALQINGRESQGLVTDKSYRGRGLGYVSYEFEVDGTTYSGKAAAAEAIFDRLHEGDSLSVRYLPATPEVNRPAAWDDPAPLNWWALLLPGFLLFMACEFIWGFPLQYRVAVNGVPAWACIAEREWTRPSRGGHWENYTFRLANDEVQFGRCPMGVTIKMGATVCVLYLPDKPTVSHIYPLDFFEVEQ